MHPDLPTPPTRPKWIARALIGVGAALSLLGAAHFSGVLRFDPNLAFTAVVSGLLVLGVGAARRMTLPRRADVLRALYQRAAPIKMTFAIRPVPVKGQEHVEYVADLWPAGARHDDDPAAWLLIDRGDGYGVPWFVALTDGQEAWAHGGANSGGPIVLEVADRLVLPQTLSSTWRKGALGGKRWHRPKAAG